MIETGTCPGCGKRGARRLYAVSSGANDAAADGYRRHIPEHAPGAPRITMTMRLRRRRRLPHRMPRFAEVELARLYDPIYERLRSQYEPRWRPADHVAPASEARRPSLAAATPGAHGAQARSALDDGGGPVALIPRRRDLGAPPSATREAAPARRAYRMSRGPRMVRHGTGCCACACWST
ncbi:MAG: hypothetical protein EA355_09640 [Rhodobacteraceae bacterium]|nr:MAG: hypothetical protein EA355_09640 [Paracoccaceae bacterium]